MKNCSLEELAFLKEEFPELLKETLTEIVICLLPVDQAYEAEQ